MLSARRLWQFANGPERLALIVVVATPVTLFLDYRVHLAPYDALVYYRPIGEAGGRPQPYHQLIGLTQVMWLASGCFALAFRRTRSGFWTLPVVALIGLLAVILFSTAAQSGVDTTTAILLTSTLLPLIAMAGILFNPLLSTERRRDLVLVAIAWAVVVVALTIAKKAYAGALHDRFTTFAFGAPTDTGLVLAALLILVPAVRVGPRIRIGLALLLTLGLLLTQTRGALVSAVAGVLVLAFFVPRWRYWLLIGAAVATVAFALGSHRSLAFGDLATKYRGENLSAHWHLFTQKPVFGWGLSEETLPRIRAAHNAFLGVADVGGSVALVLFVLAWTLPVVYGVARGLRTPTTAAMAATWVAVLVGWNTTGAEILVYTAPTDFLPLVLACSLGMSSALVLRRRGWLLGRATESASRPT